MDDYKGSFNDQNSSFDSFELQLTSLAKDYLRETAKWAKFLAILGFIFIGFMVLGSFFMFAAGSAMDRTMSGMGGMNGMGGLGSSFGAAMGIFYLLGALLYFFPVLYLYKFASNAKNALSNSNTQQLTDAFSNLKSHYKFVGILTIIVLSIYFLAIILIAVVGIGAAAMS